MKGCARSCLLLLVGWAAAAYAFYVYFVRLHDFGPPMYWASVVAGLFVVASIGYAVGIVIAHRERRMLLEAMTGTPPADGKWVGISGTIQSTTPLTAPLSGQRVVAYEYKIARDERVGKSSSEVIYYDGKALAPGTIATRHGSVRLLAVPSFNDIEAEPLVASAALERATAYIHETPFAAFKTSKERRTHLEEEWTDDDGQYRVDRQRHDYEIDLADGFRFHEKNIKQGEQVCAFGLYSRQRGGLIPHPNWAKQLRLMRGDTLNVAAQLRKRMIQYTFGVVIFAALAYGIVRFYQYQVALL
jgi:hypothetical protein